MPTFREDLHSGHKVPTVETDDIVDRGITSDKIALQAIVTELIKDLAVTTAKLADGAVTAEKLGALSVLTNKIADLAVTAEKIAANAVTNEKLANNAVETRNIKDRNVTGIKIAKECIKSEHLDGTFVPEVIKPITDDLQNQIDSLEIAGVAISNKFGADTHIGISQATLTDEVNNIYHLLEEALGRTLLGFTWNVTPTYIYGEWPTTIHVAALPTNSENQFEYIKLSVNGETVDEVVEKTGIYSFDIDLQESVAIRLDAQVLGMPYYRTTDIRHYDSFWLGGGVNYADVMIEADNINFSEGTRLAKDVTVADGEHIIIVMGESWVPAFIRADMNGVEIEFDETTVTIDGKNYKVLTSKSVFEAGTYNIDING